MPQTQPLGLDLSRAEVKKPALFGKGGKGWDALGAFFDGLSGNDTYWRHKMQTQQMEREDARLKLAQAQEARIAGRPVFNSVPNVGLVSTNPDTGESRVIQPARSSARAYVEDDLGLTPADPEYHVALADYLLKGNGPTAFGYRSELQDDKQAAAVSAMQTRLGLQQKMADYREGLIRSRPAKPRASDGGGSPARSTNAVVAPILLKWSQGKPLTPAEQQVLEYNRGRGRGGGGSTLRVQPGGGPPRVPGTRENPATLTNPADVKYLPSGTFFRDPSGTLRQKP